MRKYCILYVVLFLIALGMVGCKDEYSEKPFSGETEVIEETEDDEKFTGEVIDLINEYDGEKIDESALKNPYYSKRLIVKGNGEKLDLTGYGAKVVICGPDNLYVLQFTAQDAAKAACEELAGRSDIEYCEPDQYTKITEEESSEPMSWGVHETGADVYAEHVKQRSENDKVIVAVVDTGVYKHPFLKNRIAPHGKDFVDDDFNPDDLHSHGTHVAGTIVDCTPNLNIQILPVRVLGADGFGSHFRVSLGIRYAVNQGADVINLSLVGGRNNIVDDAVLYARSRRCTVVVAAGNENEDTENYSPAHLENCIVVAAVDENLKKANFSNWGESIDIAAPGVNIVSCVPELSKGSVVGGTTTRKNGTSMATPHIAAFAAMIKMEKPTMSPDEVLEELQKHCVDLGDAGWDSYYGWGVPDFRRNTEPSEPPKKETVNVDAEEVYREVLQEYKAAAEHNFAGDLIEQGKYINGGAWNLSGDACIYDGYSIYYRMEDFTGDGNPELFISVNERELLDVYGMQNGKPVRVLNSNLSVAYRSRSYITKDKKIKNTAVGGALDTRIEYYKFSDAGTSLELEKQYIYNGWEGDTYTYIDSNHISTNISKEEYMHLYSEYDVDFESGWELLY